jgi:pyrimidine-nucleoside phosphorylase
MLPAVIIGKKRDGEELTKDEIQFLIDGYANGEIPDYQMSAWAMAVFIRGMTEQETACLTNCMIESGEVMRRQGSEVRVDKHSTGGLGDKTSLILAPLLACFDLHVPMISGRGLGITGGTLDKLEAIPGFRTDLTTREIDNQLSEIGCVITGATESLVPADRKLYALRDVTATVPSIPLITASIMSKKLAESLDALVLDVKFGSGAFMTSLQEALKLAASLVRTGQRMQVDTRALLTDMSQPLGTMVGNANEVNESIDILRGEGPQDTRDLTLELGASLLFQTKKAPSLASAREQLEKRLDDGSAWIRFQKMVRAQGGRIDSHLPLAESYEIESNTEGYLYSWDGQLLGQSMIELGGGRRIAIQRIDHGVGLEMLVRKGDSVLPGQPIIRVYSRDEHKFHSARELLVKSYTVSSEPPAAIPLHKPFVADS